MIKSEFEKLLIKNIHYESDLQYVWSSWKYIYEDFIFSNFFIFQFSSWAQQFITNTQFKKYDICKTFSQKKK